MLNKYKIQKGEGNITEKYIKSPLNYVGGKHKLLPQILPLFPENVKTFYDIFAGGGNVGVNVNADKIIFNDIETAVISLLEDLSKLNSEQAVLSMKDIIDKYKLSKTNEDGFRQLREDYNSGNKSWYMFYGLITHAFNNQIRFNKSGGYNMPFGKNRSSFNPTLEKRFVEFVDRLSELNIEFSSKDFREYLLADSEYKSNDFVYLDPPYLISVAAYNENGGWTEEDERDLLIGLDKLNEKNVKFALSNVLESKGKSNDILKEWVKSYNTHYLNVNYSNANHQRKNRDKKDIEVLITNY